jgi:cleavage and polyadenylation specificity factor subunit 3
MVEPIEHYIDGDKLEILPLGAGNEVGRSCIVMKFRGKTIMFDCGLHPGLSGLNALPCFDDIDVETVDLLLVTHFHLDHSGALPYFLTKTVFNGSTFMTHPTKAILKLLFSDYVKVSNIGSDAERLYSPQDLSVALDQCRLVDYHQELEHKGIKFWCYNAGHVIGAAMFMVEIAGIRVLYTGDYSCEDDRHLKPAEVPDIAVDILIVESTYGTKLHEPRIERERLFTSQVHGILRQGGRCLLPVFALGRAQELLLILDEYWDSHPEIQHIPIYYASSLAQKCMTVFQTYINMMGDRVRQHFDQGVNPFIFKHISNLKSMDYFDDNSSSVVMASPGMLQNGQSRELFERWCHDPRNGTVLTGYCVDNTLAKELRSQPSEISMSDGSVKPLNMSVSYISFSAHADFKQTSNFIEQLKPSYVVLVHGDVNEMARLKGALERKFRMNVYSPANHQTVEFSFQVRKNVKLVQSDDFEEGVVLKKDTEHIIMPIEAVPHFTNIQVNRIFHKMHVPYAYHLRTLQRLIKGIFNDVRSQVEDEVTVLLVEGQVKVRPQSNGCLSLEWRASPMNDTIADTIALTILQVNSNPNPALLQAMRLAETDSSNFDFAVQLLQKRFSEVLVDTEARHITINKGGFTVQIDFETVEVSGDNETLVECVKELVGSVKTM